MKLKFCALILMAGGLITGFSGHAEAASGGERRVALVIGNAAYQEADLLNPVNDAQDLASVLSKFDFEVKFFQNLNRQAMRDAIKWFKGELTENTVGLFYYAGHGVQISGVNYLIPLGVNINSESDVLGQSIDAALVLRAMKEARNPMNIVILDACRNNPFNQTFMESSQGLAKMDAPVGSLVAYATAPGSVAADGYGRNGVYTKYLLEAIPNPELGIEQVFKKVRAGVTEETLGLQVPWEESSLTRDFYFNQVASKKSKFTNSSAVAPSAIGQMSLSDDIIKERTLWQGIVNSDDVSDFEMFLAQYPDGIFSTYARSRVAKLSASGDKVESQPIDVQNVFEAEETAPDLSTKQQDSIGQLLLAAESALDENRLTTPPGNNAYTFYQIVLQRRPADVEALKGIERVVDRYIALAQQQRRRGNARLASLYVTRALIVNPDSREALTIKESLTMAIHEDLPQPASHTNGTIKVEIPDEDHAGDGQRADAEANAISDSHRNAETGSPAFQSESNTGWRNLVNDFKNWKNPFNNAENRKIGESEGPNNGLGK